ncbi:MAG: glycosyltransferase family 4 protein [Bacteroidales bacterium]|nr:glycosyltransferase family 4 protein [Bacteroidales bacterium]
MKKALIISYYWPPSGGAGVQRWLKFVKYLRDFDWEPVIYCPENPEYPETDLSLFKDIPDNLDVLKFPIWEPYNVYKKLLGQKKEDKINAAFLTERKKNKTLEYLSVWIRGNFFIPDARKFWIRPSVRFLKQYLRDHPVDVIVSTGPPHSTHMIARQLASWFKLPWLADFRDPWTNIDFYKDLNLTSRADKRHHELELEVLRNADAVTVISNSMAEDFIKIFPRPYEVITNGYDTADTAHTPPAKDDKFSIAHIGTLVSSRNPVTLWEALKSLISVHADLKKDLEIKLVGKVDITVTASLENYGLTGFVTKTDYMPHDEVVRCQQQSQVLLLIINNTPNSKMILTGKFFEYLAAGRPVLCLGPEEGDAAKILEETNAGLLAGFSDIEKMKQHILQYYESYKKGTLTVQSRGIEKYSRRSLTGRLALILQQLSSSSNPSGNTYSKK